MKTIKRSTQIYLALVLLGTVLIGLGCGISVFEISGYRTADYSVTQPDPALPALELATKTLEAPLNSDSQFKLNYYSWYNSGYDVQIDNTLQDKVLIQITGPKDLYDYYLTQEGPNYYRLDFSSRPFESMQLFLQTAKEGYIIYDMPPIQVTLLMNEAQAKNFKLNEERDRANEMASNYEERLQEQEERYQEQLNSLDEQRNTQLEDMQESYENQLLELQQQYEEQLSQKEEELTSLQEQYEEKIISMQEQLDAVRSSLN